MFKATLIKSQKMPVYWNITDGKIRLTINVYQSDKQTLKEAKEAVKIIINKLNS